MTPEPHYQMGEKKSSKTELTVPVYQVQLKCNWINCFPFFGLQRNTKAGLFLWSPLCTPSPHLALSVHPQSCPQFHQASRTLILFIMDWHPAVLMVLPVITITAALIERSKVSLSQVWTFCCLWIAGQPKALPLPVQTELWNLSATLWMTQAQPFWSGPVAMMPSVSWTWWKSKWRKRRHCLWILTALK